MKKLLLTTILSVSVATGANATKFTDSFNDYTTNQPIANGGQGGNSKANAKSNSNATGIAGALSGSKSGVYGSGNSDVRNSVKNAVNSRNDNTNIQGQYSSNEAYNGGNSLDNANSATNEGNNTEVSIVEQHNYRRIPANSAYAPQLTSGIDTCLGSFSAGGQLITGGISFGGTKVDENCVRLKQAKLFEQFGKQKTALALFCADDNVRIAYAISGEFDCGDSYDIKQEVAYNANNSCDYPSDCRKGVKR